ATLVLLLVSCEVRSAAMQGVPPLAVSSLVACLGIFAIKATVAVAPYVRRLAALRPAKPCSERQRACRRVSGVAQRLHGEERAHRDRPPDGHADGEREVAGR